MLLLENEELSNEKLMQILDLVHLRSIVIYQKDGTIVYSCGNEAVTPEFLQGLTENRAEITDDGVYYNAVLLRGDLYLATGVSQSELEGQAADGYDLVPKDFMTGELYICDLKSNKLVMAPEELLEMPLDSLISYHSDAYPEVYLLDYDDTTKIAIGVTYEEQLLLSVHEMGSIIAYNFKASIVPALFGFGFLTFLLVFYVDFIRTDMRTGKIRNIHYIPLTKKCSLNSILFRKFCAVALVGAICITGGLYYLQLLIHTDYQRQHADRQLNLAETVLEYDLKKIDSMEDEVNQEKADAMRDIRSVLSYKPSLLNENGLDTLMRLYNFHNIYIMDEYGETLYSNSSAPPLSISTDPEHPVYIFWDVINGFARGCVLWVEESSEEETEEEGNLMIYVGLTSDSGRGMVLGIYEYDKLYQWIRSNEVAQSLHGINVTDRSKLLAIEPVSGMCMFDSSGEYTEKYIGDIGIAEEYLQNGYAGTHKIGGNEYLITARDTPNLILLYITQTNQVLVDSWVVTSIAIFVSLLVILITLFPRFIVKTPGEDIMLLPVKDSTASKYKRVKAVLSEESEWQFVEEQVERPSMRMRWESKDADAKLRFILRMLLPLAVGYFLFVLLAKKEGGNSLILNHILERNWDKRFSIYSVSYVFIVVSGIWFVASILQKFIKYMMNIFGAQWRTSGVLFYNLIRYGALVGSIFFALHSFGVETSTLVTSAGVLTMVFGFGAQSLVADLIAGIFLIFEGTFRVGDIVTIENWRGEVIEIGLRATKIKNDMGNVKIFQNSKIHGAVNMTSEQSFAYCDFPLPRGVQLEQFEDQLLSEFFPLAQEKVPGLSYPLKYEGVIAMNGAYSTLRISVKCLEEERERLQQELFRVLTLWQQACKFEAPVVDNRHRSYH